MGLPVILNVNIRGVGLHAITITGYRIENKRQNETETVPNAEFYCPLKGLRIKEFYAHDDRIGPFCRIEIIDADNLANGKHPLPVNFRIPATGEILEPHSVIIPLYHKIRVVFLRLYEWIWHLHTVISASNILPEDIEWDIYLSDLEHFKQELLKDSIYSHMRPMLQLKRLPRFIWIAKLTYKNEPLLEMIADATDMDRSFFFKGIIFFNDYLKDQINNLVNSRTEALQKFLTVPFTNFLKEQSKR